LAKKKQNAKPVPKHSDENVRLFSQIIAVLGEHTLEEIELIANKEKWRQRRKKAIDQKMRRSRRNRK
jgi:hypothetical protein